MCGNGIATPETLSQQKGIVIQGKLVYIDACIYDIVKALNATELITTASCCGHNSITGRIDLQDGRVISIFKSPDEWAKIITNFKPIHEV